MKRPVIIDANGTQFEVEILCELDTVELSAGRLVERGQIIEADYVIDGVQRDEVGVLDLIALHHRLQRRRR